MPPRSKIKMLPKTTRARIDRFLEERERGVDEFLAFLNEEIGLQIARASAHRYQQKFEKVASRLRQSREMTEALASELGDAATQGKQGRLLVEMARGLVYDLLTKLQDAAEEGGQPLAPKDVADLGKGLAQLGVALRSDQAFELKIMEVFAAKAADAVEKVARKNGLSAETVEQFRLAILGIAARE